MVGQSNGHITLTFQQYFALLTQPHIVKRGRKFSLIVGTILVLINHLETLLYGEIDLILIRKIILTYAVPYVVSSLSSVQAIKQQAEN